MNFLGLHIETKKELRKKLADISEENNRLTALVDELVKSVSLYKSTFPFRLGETVYDLQLRSTKGRYTKTNPSIEHSLINEVIVDEDNYFNLLNRYTKHDVFMTYDAAYTYLVGLCSK